MLVKQTKQDVQLLQCIIMSLGAFSLGWAKHLESINHFTQGWLGGEEILHPPSLYFIERKMEFIGLHQEINITVGICTVPSCLIWKSFNPIFPGDIFCPPPLSSICLLLSQGQSKGNQSSWICFFWYLQGPRKPILVFFSKN